MLFKRIKISSPLQESFLQYFKIIPSKVRYLPQWECDTDYLDGVVFCSRVTKGTTAKTKDRRGRRIIVSNTAYGNLALFERYKPNAGEVFTLIGHAPPELERHFWRNRAQVNIEAIYRLMSYELTGLIQ